MSELSPATRALLAAAREGLAPDPAALRRVRGGVEAAISTGSIPVAGLVLVAVAAALAISAVASRMREDVTVPALSFAPSVIGSPIHEQRIDRAYEQLPPRHIEIGLEVPARPAAAAVRVSSPPALVVEPTAASIDLAREVELIDAAMAALRSANAPAALASIRVYHEETRGAGQLAEDAAAIEVEVLCKQQSPRGVQLLQTFDRRWPTSAQRSRLVTACRTIVGFDDGALP